MYITHKDSIIYITLLAKERHWIMCPDHFAGLEIDIIQDYISQYNLRDGTGKYVFEYHRFLAHSVKLRIQDPG